MGQLLDMLGLGMLAVLAFGIYFLIAYLFARLCWLVMPSTRGPGPAIGFAVVTFLALCVFVLWAEGWFRWLSWVVEWAAQRVVAIAFFACGALLILVTSWRKRAAVQAMRAADFPARETGIIRGNGCYLVWVRGATGRPLPQRWSDESFYDMHKRERPYMLRYAILPDDMHLSLSELAALPSYAPPVPGAPDER